MLVEIAGTNEMYTTKRYKRAHSVLNLRVKNVFVGFFSLLNVRKRKLAFV